VGVRLHAANLHCVDLEAPGYEYAGAELPAPDRLRCFIDRLLGPGYFGWVFAGVDGVRAGLARRPEGRGAFKPREATGGVVAPAAVSRAWLVGDAAGMVSPVTAGGIHTALQHGLAAGYAVVDFLDGRAEDPCSWFVQRYPGFRLKGLLRFLCDHFRSDLAFDRLLATRPIRCAASIVYFHQRGVLGAAERRRLGGLASRALGGAGPRSPFRCGGM
jgi:digeranylgeranylglycerophospholipid reductase